MSREISIPHADLQDPQTVTQRNIRAFKENDLDIHRHEVEDLIDDHSQGRRILKIKNVKFFDMGRRG